MGGGPTDSDSEEQSPIIPQGTNLLPPPAEPADTLPHQQPSPPQPTNSSAPSSYPSYQSASSPQTTTAPRAGMAQPVLSTTTTAAVAGAFLGTVFGFGPRSGLLVGALLGSYAAARNDGVGQHARVVGQAGTNFANNLTQSEIAASIKRKAEELQVPQRVAELDRKYEIGSRIKQAVNVTLATAEEKVLPTAALFISAAHEKIKGMDSNQYIEQAEQKIAELDQSTGLSNAVARTTQALISEIKGNTKKSE